MKLKYMIVVSLILAVFAISAVSASQDIVNDANLTANEPVDSLNESPVDEVILTKENEEAIGAEPSDFEVNIAEKVNISEMY